MGASKGSFQPARLDVDPSIIDRNFFNVIPCYLLATLLQECSRKLYFYYFYNFQDC